MKILAIRGQNLASLARSFAVELGQGDLANVGLFAITGPVGAGKSTLLDALCLALFDRTPRLCGRGGTAIGDDGQPQNDWLRANDPRTLLRRNAIDGYAEVDFVGRDGVVYRARWSVRRARQKPDGRLQEQELSLIDLARDVVVQSGRRTEVLAAIRQRLGLDFQQFCRSVLLAQGEFHAFLHAAPDERARLLETLTGASIYRRLSKAAHERRRAGEKRVELLRVQLDQSVVLDDEARVLLEAELVRLVEQLTVCDLGIGLAQQYVLWHRSAEQHRLAESEATVALEQARRASEAAEPRRRQLHSRQQAIAVFARWEVALQARDDERAQSEQLAVAEREHEQLQQRVEDETAALRQLMTEHLGASEQVPAMSLAAMPALVRELQHFVPLLERWQQSEQDAAATARQLPAQLAAVGAVEQRLADLRRQGEELSTTVVQHADAVAAAEQAAAGEDLEVLAREHTELEAERVRLGAFAQAVGEWQRAEHSAQQATAQLRALQIEEPQRTAATLVAERALAAAGDELQAARARARASEQQHGLASLRAELVDGEPCPLCGAHEHPAVFEHAPTDLAAAEAAARRAQQACDDARQQLATATAESQRVARELAAAEREAEVRARASAAARAACAVDGQVFEQVATAGQWLAERQQLLEQRRRAMAATEARTVARSQALCAAMQAAAKADAAWRRHVDAMAQAERELAAASTAARDLQRQGERQLRALTELRHDLEPACREIPGGVDRIEAMGGERLAVLRTLHDRVRRHIEASTAAATAAAELERATVRRRELRSARERVEQALQTALTVSGVSEHDVAVAHRLGADALHEEAAALQALTEEVARRRTELSLRSRLRREHEQHERPSLDPAEAQRALEDAQEARRRAGKDHVAALLRRQMDDQMRRHRGELQPRLDRAEQELSVWSMLDDLIGSSSGDQFAVFAQGLTLDLLLIEANRRLEELARRYRLEKSRGGELDFVVVDLDMGGTRRSLHTLSGGETFLVSLALALALATLAAPQSRVETLFLDEGFGTLDAHNLEIAIGALDSLQATGCQVGVISHVDGFAERIGAVVEVRPEGSGQSRVVVRSA